MCGGNVPAEIDPELLVGLFSSTKLASDIFNGNVNGNYNSKQTSTARTIISLFA